MQAKYHRSLIQEFGDTSSPHEHSPNAFVRWSSVQSELWWNSGYLGRAVSVCRKRAELRRREGIWKHSTSFDKTMGWKGGGEKIISGLCFMLGVQNSKKFSEVLVKSLKPPNLFFPFPFVIEAKGTIILLLNVAGIIHSQFMPQSIKHNKCNWVRYF